MEQDEVISLRDYLIVLRRQLWVIALTATLVVVAAVAVSMAQTPIYQAESEVVVEPIRRTQDISLEQLLGSSNAMVETERRIILSRPVTDRVIEELGAGDPDELRENVVVEVVRDTRIVRIAAEDPDPVAAASIANAYAASYLDYRRDQAVESLLAARSSLEDRAEQLREQVQSLDAQIDVASEDEAASLQVQRDSLLAQLSQVVGQMAEMGDSVDVVTGGGDIIEPASVPSVPVRPQPLRTGALGLVLGLLLGVGFAFLRDHFDDVVRDEEDLKRATAGRPLLGRIPTWKDPEDADRLVTIIEPSAVTSEAYRELSAGVRFLLLTGQGEPPADGDGAGRSLMFTSALAGDGKTSTAGNLAVAAARVGLKTVLVDADLRRSAVGGRFGLGRTTGLSDVLLSNGQVADHLVDVGVDNLLVLTAGTIPPNPNELLASPSMVALHRQLTGLADLVIYDTPAALAVPDALELGHLVDLTILVCRQGVTGRRQLGGAIERLEQTGTSVGGTVLNDIDASAGAYYYAYEYLPDEPKGRGSSRGASDRRASKAAKKRGPSGEDAPAESQPSQQPASKPAAQPSGETAEQDRGVDAWESFFARGTAAAPEDEGDSAPATPPRGSPSGPQ